VHVLSSGGVRGLPGLLVQEFERRRLGRDPVHFYRVLLHPGSEHIMYVFAGRGRLQRARACVRSRDLVASVKQCRTNPLCSAPPPNQHEHDHEHVRDVVESRRRAMESARDPCWGEIEGYIEFLCRPAIVLGGRCDGSARGEGKLARTSCATANIPFIRVDVPYRSWFFSRCSRTLETNPASWSGPDHIGPAT
jgi:hypothetical protein